MTTMIVIPRRPRGRPTAEGQRAYEAMVEEFCRQVEEIRGSLDFEVSAWGWCYILEEHGATKPDFPTIERLFVACRKSGDLPLDICAEDEARAAEHVELDEDDPTGFAQGWIDHIRDHVHQQYNPVSLWDGSDYYCEMWVEKIDLKSLFSDICKRYTIPLINIRGRTCLNSRAGTMERFLEREAEGKTCVLLYCGDHDPSGLEISGSIILGHRKPIGCDRLFTGRSGGRPVRAQPRLHRGRGLELVGELGDSEGRGFGQSKTQRPQEVLCARLHSKV
jgi:hypothetical protein